MPGSKCACFGTQPGTDLQCELQVSVFNSDLWTAGEYVYNHFVEGLDKECFLAPDRINAAQVSRGFWQGAPQSA